MLCPKKMSQKDYIVINNLENHNEEVNENTNVLEDADLEDELIEERERSIKAEIDRAQLDALIEDMFID